jgi:hypothetical protein
MKTLYLTDSMSNIAVDPEENKVTSLPGEDRYDIRNVYYIEEPMHVVYDSAECHEEIDARKGDILLLFYSNRYNKYHLDTIRSKQWAANIKNRHAIEQKEKEEWAKRNADCDCAKCCDECCCNLTAEPAPKAEKCNIVEDVKKAVKKAVKKIKK